MAVNPQVFRLLEEMLESGRMAEDLCRDCPELLPEVRKNWQKFRLINAHVDALLPGLQTPPFGDAVPSGASAAGLPQISGYEVEAVLGHGGMGIVYKARDLQLNRPVALKMLLTGAFATADERERFLREAKAEAGLIHPHIVQVHQVGDHDGRPYYTMEFVEGGSLAQKLQGTPQLARQAAGLVATLAQAIHVAHQRGIVHRDLKPANVLLSADGAPKIADFGLAGLLEGTSGLTLSGVPIGTPSYMAPEQALGKSRDVGGAVDTYSLGAILYELLTGRPPFRAETAAETLQQVISQEPVPPRRLNAAVPRDAETICLKCLEKQPHCRYSSAAALADDLHRFQRGDPITARPVRGRERLARWMRRNPTQAGLVATVLALIVLAVGGGLRLEQQRAERHAERAIREARAGKAIEAALEHAAVARKQGRWSEVRAALEGSVNLLEISAPADLRQSLIAARADAEMALDLEEIRLRLSESGMVPERSPSADQAYADAFRNYGIALTAPEPAEAAARIRNSAIRDTLLAFFYDWLYWASDADRDKLRALLDQVDDDPWRREFSEALALKDEWKLNSLARADGATAQPPVVLTGLVGTLIYGSHSRDAMALLREAQERHPQDFWINYLLGLYWIQESAQEAVGYCRVAVAIRPNSDQAYALLGRALRAQGNTNGASAAFRKALALNPNCPVGKDLANATDRKSGLEEARVAWEKLVNRDPPSHDAWYGYAELCLYLGNTQAYRWARERLLDRFGETADNWIIAERASMACMLLPASGDELRRAAELAERAVTAGDNRDAGNPYVRFVKGLAEYRQGRCAEAVPWLRDSAASLPNRPGPRLALAMALFQSGSANEARQTLAIAVRDYDWNDSAPASTADPSIVWVSHILRREAEAMIVPNLAAYLQGEYQPQDNDERIALLGVCQSENRFCAAARLYADAFVADPHLPDDLATECLRRTRAPEHPGNLLEVFNSACRYHAARCAALAGSGLGSDGLELNAADRMRWRRQAREWLQADLSAWARMIEGDSQVSHDLAKRMLEQWQIDPDLAGLRDSGALNALSPDERQECLKLWNDVVARLRSKKSS